MTLAAFIEMIYICIHHGTISLQLNKQSINAHSSYTNNEE